MRKSNESERGCLFLVGVIIACIFLMLWCSRLASAQSVASVTYHPVDHGIGLRADLYPAKESKALFKRFGSYYAVTYGNWGLYKRFGIDHHVTLTSGILIPLKSCNEWLYNLSLGVNYHHLGKGYIEHYTVAPNIYKSWSYELGLSVRMKRTAVCIATDIRRFEPGVGFGFFF